MTLKRVFQVHTRFADAEQAEHDYYTGLTPAQRLDILLELRARHEATFGIRESTEAESQRGHARAYRISHRSRG